MIINRYLVREVTGPFVAVSAVLVIVFMTYSLTVFLTDASEGLLGAGQVAALTLLKTVIALEVLLPIGLYVAVMLGMGRLYNDSEMDAVRAAGMGEAQILMPILRLALLLALLVALLSMVVRPLVYNTLLTLRAQAEANSEIDRIKSGRFYSYSASGRTVFIEATRGSLDNLQGVFIRTRNAEGLQVISAREGRFVQRATPTHHQLTLRDSSVFKRTTSGRDVFGEFAEFTVLLPIKQPEPVASRPKIASTLDLRYVGNPRERAEFEWRLSTPVSTLLLAMLAIPLSRSRPRQGRYARMLVALVVYALYFNLLRMTRNWVEQDSMATIAWVPGILALAIVIWYVPWRSLWRRFRVKSHAPA
ncbi:MAG: LPS export ABC transporter permease LptF [Xanthomonadaceae bacterium]|nr:LPS export ABC transporter permease LptF [Xanthomonadaceae bacterium]